MELQIRTESSCDIPQDQANKTGIKALYLSVSFGEEENLDSVMLNSEEFFNMLKSSGEFPQR